MMNDLDATPPWDTAPVTLDEMAASISAQLKWEEENGRSAPSHWCIMFSSKVMNEIILRLYAVEHRVGRD